MSNQKGAPRFFVACQVSMFFGAVHGVWLDPSMDEEEIGDHVADMLFESPFVEFDTQIPVIWKTEGFYGLGIARDETPEEVRVIASFIQEHGEAGAGLIQRYGSLQKAKGHVPKSPMRFIQTVRPVLTFGGGASSPSFPNLRTRKGWAFVLASAMVGQRVRRHSGGIRQDWGNGPSRAKGQSFRKKGRSVYLGFPCHWPA